MREYLRDYLVCPACQGELVWDVAKKAHRLGEDIVDATATCSACGATYPVRDGIAIFLTPDLPREDLWEQVEGQLSQYLNQHPEIDEQLLKTSLDELKPADKFMRGMVLSERGDYEGALQAFADSEGIYTPEYNAAQESQIAYVVERVSHTSGPIIDLASGMGALVQPLVKHDPTRPLVITDFSPRVLRSDRARFSYLGIAENLDYLALDARRTPFKTLTIPLLTSHVGLQNMRAAKDAIREVGRVLKGSMIATAIFYPPGDPDTDSALADYGSAETNHKDRFATVCKDSGLALSIENLICARALPTPESEITGLGLDALPLKEMLLEWCTVVLKSAAPLA